MANRYEIIISWSDEDQAFIADVPELSGCMAHGSSHAEARTNAQDAITLWLDTAREHGDPVPEGKGRRLRYDSMLGGPMRELAILASACASVSPSIDAELVHWSRPDIECSEAECMLSPDSS